MNPRVAAVEDAVVPRETVRIAIGVGELRGLAYREIERVTEENTLRAFSIPAEALS